jgi:hypothetical protein
MVYSSDAAKNRLSNETARRISEGPVSTGRTQRHCHDLPQRDLQQAWPFG